MATTLSVAQAQLSTWPRDQYSSDGKPLSQPPRTGPEFQNRPTRFKMSQFARHWYRYVEAPENPELSLLGIEPIDQINQALFDQGYKCLASWQLRLPALQPVGREIRHFGDKTYVLKCDGACENVFYTASARGYRQVTVFGLQPFPMLEIANGFGYANAGIFIWNRSQDPESSVSIGIYQWTKDVGDYGGGCRIR